MPDTSPDVRSVPESVVPPPRPPAPADRIPIRTRQIIAVVTGLIGMVFALATPLLPVTQTVAVVDWPQVAGVPGNIDAPLVAQTPISLTASIDCAAVASLPESGGLLLATAPPQGADAAVNAMFVRVGANVDVVVRNVVLASAPREQVQNGGCSTIEINSTSQLTSVEYVGLNDDTGEPVRGEQVERDERPQVVGIFSDLPTTQGVDLSMTVDSRFSTTPTLLKMLVMVVGVLATIVSLFALAALDITDGRSHRRIVPAHWWKFTAVDGAVVGILGLWHIIGANTSDDGYILTMARAAEHSGYMANYYRWYGVPEAPFGWYYDVLAAMTNVSTASVWMRLPALIAAVLCWMVISREVVPRLGAAVRGSQTALWTGGFVFLAFWLAYNNGLRPEPIVALGALLTWCSIERGIATGRLLPIAVACMVGAFTLAAAPTGLMCVAALLAAIRPMTRLVVRRSRDLGLLPILAPIAAAGTVVLVAVFRDQTWAAVSEATRVRNLVGPAEKWYEDFLRYYYLFVETVDGSLTRRFAFLIMVLCLVVTILTLVRKPAIRGIARGPAWRLVAIVLGTMFFMMFNPTKWTHHFGAYAGIAGALGALAAVLVSSAVLRARRNRSYFAAGLILLVALSFSGINGYWYVSAYGVPWFDKAPSIKGITATSVLLIVFVIVAAVATWQYLRDDGVRRPERSLPAPLNLLRRLAGIPLTLMVGGVVALMVLSLLKGAVSQYPAYSLARGNIDALAGNSCGLANDVLVEPDANAGALNPIFDPLNPADPDTGPLGGTSPSNFTPNGIDTDLAADAIAVDPGMGNTEQQSVGPTIAEGQSAGTAGGTGAVGVNGSTAKLPFGLDPARTPVLGSYQQGIQEPAKATSSWYALPERSEDRPLIVFSAAGRIWSIDDTGASTYGQSVVLEYGRLEANGDVTVEGEYLPRDIGPAPSWRNLRIPMSGISADANVVRIVANDPNLTGDQWLAFTPPRVPYLETLQNYLGSEQPILLDWAVGLQFPCQRPFDHRYGIAEVPDYRILPDRPLAVSSTDTWQSNDNGGPLGWAEMLSEPVTVPSYLRDDWGRDWGSLERYLPYYPASPAEPITHDETRWGWWSPGQIRRYP